MVKCNKSIFKWTYISLGKIESKRVGNITCLNFLTIVPIHRTRSIYDWNKCLTFLNIIGKCIPLGLRQILLCLIHIMTKTANNVAWVKDGRIYLLLTFLYSVYVISHTIRIMLKECSLILIHCDRRNMLVINILPVVLAHQIFYYLSITSK